MSENESQTRSNASLHFAASTWKSAITLVVAMSSFALILIAATTSIDSGFTLQKQPQLWLDGLRGEAAFERVSNAAEVVSGVLSIAIMVVAIIVELAANRYTPYITSQFIRNRTNQLVLSYFVLTTIVCLWASTAPLQTFKDAYATSTLAMSMATVSLLILLPYFLFVFSFLAPPAVIERIRSSALESASRGRRKEMLEYLEELEDLARGARQNRDRTISLLAVDSLHDFLHDYQAVRRTLPAAWFRIDEELTRDPDFVGLAPAAAQDIEQQRIWLEAKVLRQYLSLFEGSMREERDLANLIALNTRRIGQSLGRANEALFNLTVRFFNSYLRLSVRAGEQRSAYYVLDQYRGLAECELERKNGSGARRIARHLHEYGSFARDLGLPFIFEVAAFDFATLIEKSLTDSPTETDPMLEGFLEIGRECQLSSDYWAGIRRTEVQLATCFLEIGDIERAKQIASHMRGEQRQLEPVLQALEKESRAQYWEFTDRGINFSYLPPERRTLVREVAHLIDG